MALAITSRGGGSQSSAVTTHTVDFGSAPSSGQLLLVIFRRDGDDGGPDITAPAGWTTVAGGFATDFDAYVYAKIAGGSEPSTYDWTTSDVCTSGHRWHVIGGFTNTIASGISISGVRAVFAFLAAPDPPSVSFTGAEAVGITAAVWSGSASISSYPTATTNGGAAAASNANVASAETDDVTSPIDPEAFSISGGATTLGITIVVYNTAASSNTGSGAITEDPDTTSTSAIAIGVGSGAITEQADTAGSAAVAINVGLGAITEADDVSASAVATAGTASITEQVDTAASTAVAINSGSAGMTEQDDTSSSTATAIQSGSAAITEQTDTSSSVAGSTQFGSAAITEQDDTSAGTSNFVGFGSAAITEANDTSAGTSNFVGFGSAAIVEQDDIASSVSGTVQTGSAAITEADDTAGSTTSVFQTGSAAITEQSDTASAISGSVQVGTAAITEADDSSSSTSVFTVVGTADITEQADSSASVSQPPVYGTAAITEQVDSPEVTSALTNVGSAAITETGDMSQSTSEGGLNVGSASILEASDSSGTSFINTGLADISELSDGATSSSSGGPNKGPMKCCCQDCQGCCFPYDYLEPPAVPTAGNYAQILRWEIDAPNCAALHGETGQFSPETTGPHDPMVFCGFCLCYNNTEAVKTLDGTAHLDNGLGDCTGTPCGITLCFGLQCARTRPVTDESECCNQFRLVVVFIGATPDGGELVDTQSQCFEGEGIGGNPNFPGCNNTADFPEEIARQLLPASCQCEDNEATPPVPFELVFDLSQLSLICPEGNFGPGHPCEGLTRCCDPVGCSFVDATVTVTRL